MTRRCPHCRSTVLDSIEYASADFPPTFYECSVRCVECGREWVVKQREPW